MRNYEIELSDRIKFIRNILETSHATGIVYGNSGGKDSALVGILCKRACENTLGVIMPCGARQNYEEDMSDALCMAHQFSIETKTIDLTPLKELFAETLQKDIAITADALCNCPPRLRMTTLYAIAASENRLVAGTGNRSEAYIGYFTKWGDGAFDFNPIADLTATEVFEFLRFLDAPQNIINKAPSAGLFDGQTDEQDMGITYAKLDAYLLNGSAGPEDKLLMERLHCASEHKRKTPPVYQANV